jgi:hypothetical protein
MIDICTDPYITDVSDDETIRDGRDIANPDPARDDAETRAAMMRWTKGL